MASEYSSLLIEKDIRSEEIQKQGHDYKAALKVFDILRTNPKKIDVEVFKSTLQEFPHIINYNFFNENDYCSLLNIVKYKLKLDSKKRRELMNVIIEIGFTTVDPIFYAAAGCNSIFLETCGLSNDDLIWVKTGDTLLAFLLKYGDPLKEHYVHCVEKLLSEENVNKLDYSQQTPLTIVLKEYFVSSEEEKNVLNDVVKTLLEKGASRLRIPEFMVKKFEENHYKLNFQDAVVSMRAEQKLFDYIIRNEPTKFTALYQSSKFLDVNDGENTLLQLSVILNRLPIVKTLLKSDINFNGFTARNLHCPLVLSAILNKKHIFQILIPNVVITPGVFNTFVRFRCLSMLEEYFYDVLKSPKLDVNMKSYQGNTPLHFAIIFGDSSSVQTLLKRGAPLTAKNQFGMECINFINTNDLELHYDSCIKFDEYKRILKDTVSKVTLDFTTLVQDCRSEVEMVKQYGSQSGTKKLLQHPLVDIFMNIKWYLCKKYFYSYAIFKILNCYMIFLILLSNHLNSVYGLLIFEALFYIIWVILSYRFFRHSGSDFICYCLLSIFLTIDVILITLYKFNFCEISLLVIKQVNSIIFVLISASIIITLGYKLNCSKWSIMLQKVVSTYFINMMFLILPLLAFATGFTQLMWKDDHKYDLFYSIYKTTQTLTEKALSKDFTLTDTENNNFVHIFITFFIILSIAIMNFFTGLAVNDIQRLGKDWEIISYNNVIVFISFVEKFYLQFPKLCTILRLPRPFIFTEDTKYQVEMFVQKNEEFKSIKRLANFKLSKISKAKISEVFQKKMTKSIDDKLKDAMGRIEHTTQETLLKVLQEIKELNIYITIILNRLLIVKTLLNSDINFNGFTARNLHCPLVLSAILNKKHIFQILIPNVVITPGVFNTFVRFRCLSMLEEYFYDVLKSPKLDVNMKSYQGNTPLHFAIIFGDSSSVQTLLKRGAPLTAKNQFDMECINFINTNDLELHYDSCIKFDEYKRILNDTVSKVTLDFTTLVQDCRSEVEIVKQYGSQSGTKKLLQHPLVDIFMNIKWYLCKKYFYSYAIFKILNCYMILLILLSNHLNSVYGLLIFEALFYIIWVILSYRFFRHSGSDFICYCLLSIFLTIDVILITLYKFNFCEISLLVIKQVNSIIFVLISASIIITLGYKLNCSKWSIMLQKVVSTYFINMMFLILPLLAFATGFTQLMWKDDHRYDLFYSIFKTTQTLTEKEKKGFYFDRHGKQ
ncbi:unnamed protein product [Brassicogethes aeneus]|uniref:Transient receptor potential cation channel protein painless-like n=1 Tax=Brassicogethes aeneus TaxID=1431903 RepID=A0A9P0AWV1_BRAAE|nr:unnamed protein product [Brassicogethes aeneus]